MLNNGTFFHICFHLIELTAAHFANSKFDCVVTIKKLNICFAFLDISFFAHNLESQQTNCVPSQTVSIRSEGYCLCKKVS